MGIKMSEDDTFNKLKRIPFKDMKELWVRREVEVGRTSFNKFFQKYGWTYKDFSEELAKDYVRS